MLPTILAFLFGLILLVVGGELLIRSATRLASELGVSRLFIGLTVVAFGTSAPEAVVGVMAALKGSSDLALGNVVGSNIFNVLFILGLSSVIMPMAVSAKLVRFDVPFLVGVSVLCFLLSFDGVLSRWDGLLFIALLAVHFYLSLRQARRSESGEPPGLGDHIPTMPEGLPRALPPWKGFAISSMVILLSLGLLVGGSRILVDSASALARLFGLSELVIGLTIVAAGTSLPEVATSVMAAIRGERDIAVGNVIGSNLLNILGVLGVSAVVSSNGIAVSPSVLSFDLIVMVAAAAICLPIFFNGMTVFRWEGALLLGYFVLYIATLITKASEHQAQSGFIAIVAWIVIPLSLITLLVAMTLNLVNRHRSKKQGS